MPRVGGRRGRHRCRVSAGSSRAGNGSLGAVSPTAPRAKSLRVLGRLPAPLTSFVGRQVEVDKVAGLLDRHRLVTVTGPGGSGKTRLAIEVGRRVSGQFAD